MRRRGDLGRDRQGARPAAAAALGRVSRQPPGDDDRRLLQPGRRTSREEVDGAARARPGAGWKFKVGGLTPEEDAARSRAAREAAAPTRALRRRQPGMDARPGDPSSRAASRSSICTGSRSPASGRTTGARCGTSAFAAASGFAPGRASSRPRVPRSHGRRGRSTLQLDSSSSGVSDRVASRRRRGPPFESPWLAEEPQIASRLLASITARDIPRGVQRPARSDLVEPRRQPAPRSSTAGIDAARWGRGSGGSSTAARSRRTGSRDAVKETGGAGTGARAGLDGLGVLVTGAAGGIGAAVAALRRRRRAGRRARLCRGGAPATSPPRSPATDTRVGVDLADVSGHEQLVEEAEERGRPARRARPPRGGDPPPARHPRDRRGGLGRAGGPQPEGGLLPQPRVRRAAARQGRGARSSTSAPGLVDGGFGGSIVYNATKGGIVTMTEVSPAPTPRPGSASTPSRRARRHGDAARRPRRRRAAGLVDQVPLRRLAPPEEVAPAVVFLASEQPPTSPA